MRSVCPPTVALLAVIACIGCVAPPAASGPSPAWGGKLDGQSEARGSWVRAEVLEHNAGLTVEERARKLRRMAGTPYAFFRGTNHLFWADFAADPRLSFYGGDEATETWLQGDLHALNFGAFDDDDGRVVYDLNDFDEAVIADYQLDVWRMAVSLVLIAEDNELDDADAIVDAFSESYLDALADYRGNDDERGRRFEASDAYGRLDEFLEDVERDRSRRRMLDRWTIGTEDGRRLDVDSEDLAPIDDALRDEIERAMERYGATLSGGLEWDPAYFAVASVARRLNAGTGSLGTPRFYVLIAGPTDSPNDDVILDVKRQAEPSGLRYLSARARASYAGFFANDAERAVLGQRALTDDVDDHLGWMQLDDGSYRVAARSPYKDTLDVTELDSIRRMTNLAEQWGVILATAHARADRDFDEDLVPHSFDREVDDRTDGDHAGFRRVTRELATAYAAQVRRDYASFLELTP